MQAAHRPMDAVPAAAMAPRKTNSEAANREVRDVRAGSDNVSQPVDVPPPPSIASDADDRSMKFLNWSKEYEYEGKMLPLWVVVASIGIGFGVHNVPKWSKSQTEWNLTLEAVHKLANSPAFASCQPLKNVASKAVQVGLKRHLERVRANVDFEDPTTYTGSRLTKHNLSKAALPIVREYIEKQDVANSQREQDDGTNHSADTPGSASGKKRKYISGDFDKERDSNHKHKVDNVLIEMVQKRDEWEQTNQALVAARIDEGFELLAKAIRSNSAPPSAQTITASTLEKIAKLTTKELVDLANKHVVPQSTFEVMHKNGLSGADLSFVLDQVNGRTECLIMLHEIGLSKLSANRLLRALLELK